MYPIPRYITRYFMLDKEKSNLHDVEGKIHCTCGCESIHIQYFGEEFINENQLRCMSINEYKDSFAFAVWGTCTKCGNLFEIFDMAKHGYDGYVCQNNLPAPSDGLQTYLCECGSDSFQMTAGFEAEDDKQFIEEAVEQEPERFKAEDYVDAFNWIVMNIQCCQCGKITDNWVNLELS